MIEKIREALIKLATEEIYQYFIDPEFLKVIISLGESSKFDKDEMVELVELYTSVEYLKEISYDAARRRYIAKDELRKEFIKDFKDIGFKSRQLKKIDSIFDKYLEKTQDLFDYRENLYSKLLELSEKIGMKKALTLENRNSVIKSLLPTTEEYKEISMLDSKTTSELKYEIEDIISKNSKINGVNSFMLDFVFDFQRGILEYLIQKDVEPIFDV